MKEYQLTPQGAQELILDMQEGPELAVSLDLTIMEEIMAWRRSHKPEDYKRLLEGDGRYFGYSNVDIRKAIDYFHSFPIDTLGNFIYLLKMRRDREFMRQLLREPA